MRIKLNLGLIKLIVVCLLSFELSAGEPKGKLLFEDTFDREESQEMKDEPGNGWTTNSQSRAKGNKQVDLRDGVMHVFIHPEADHAVSVNQPAVFTNGAVGLKFKFEDPEDRLILNFADLDCKEVHAGHLCAARISTKQVELADLKTGGMRLDIRKAREAKKPLSEEQASALIGKESKFSRLTDHGHWHELKVTIQGEQLSIEIDGEAVGQLASSGIGHPTKKLLRLLVPRNVLIDEVSIWSHDG